MRLTKTPSPHRVHDYNLALTKEELLLIANDSISDYFYTNKMLDPIKREAKRLGAGEEQS